MSTYSFCQHFNFGFVGFERKRGRKKGWKKNRKKEKVRKRKEGRRKKEKREEKEKEGRQKKKERGWKEKSNYTGRILKFDKVQISHRVEESYLTHSALHKL